MATEPKKDDHFELLYKLLVEVKNPSFVNRSNRGRSRPDQLSPILSITSETSAARGRHGCHPVQPEQQPAAVVVRDQNDPRTARRMDRGRLPARRPRTSRPGQ